MPAGCEGTRAGQGGGLWGPTPTPISGPLLQAYADYIGFILTLNEGVKGKKLTFEYPVSEVGRGEPRLRAGMAPPRHLPFGVRGAVEVDRYTVQI